MEPIFIPVIDFHVDMMPFRYMSTSKVHEKASVNMSLFSPSLTNCCDSGTQDCLTIDMPCECAKASGGEIAYNESGIFKDRFFLQGTYDSKKHEPRKFIRECSVRCRCHHECGNRVVQQGMKYPLEIFYTGQTGWGIRVSRSIPRGAFVFELAGEILTNAKMIVRNLVAPDGPSYAMQLGH
jgi:hypothetical protein